MKRDRDDYWNDGEEWKFKDDSDETPTPAPRTDAECDADEMRYLRTLEELRVLRSVEPHGYRCHKCGRVVTYRFKQLGLATIDYSFARTPDGDHYPVGRSEHLFPCVGKKIRLKDICAEFIRLANTGRAANAV